MDRPRVIVEALATDEVDVLGGRGRGRTMRADSPTPAEFDSTVATNSSAFLLRGPAIPFAAKVASAVVFLAGRARPSERRDARRRTRLVCTLTRQMRKMRSAFSEKSARCSAAEKSATMVS
jgi:hypothetical protein